MEELTAYKNLVLKKIELPDVTIGLRQIGNGKDCVFIHGFPTHGYTWRKIIPELSKKFKCHILDLPGLGDSEWSKETNFNSKSQASYVIQLLEKLEIREFSMIAHNSGATVAREIAIQLGEQVKTLVLLNTEIPHHRPPWIPFYQKIGLLPLVPNIIRFLLKQQWFIRSAMGFREFYGNKKMLDNKTNILPYTLPFINSRERTIGAFKYLKGIDWKFVDDLQFLHGKIKAPTLFLWGEKDKTFPLDLAKEMVSQFNCSVQFTTIKEASLLPHEEKFDEVVKSILEFTKC